MVTLFHASYKGIQNSQTLQGYIFHILEYFATKLDICMKFRMLFSAVLINFPNSKVCLIGEMGNGPLTIRLRARDFYAAIVDIRAKLETTMNT